MKRFTTLLLMSILLVTCMLMPLSASAEGLDYSALTTIELQDVINAARNELLARKALSEGKLFLLDEVDGVQIYLTGKTEMNWMNECNVEIVVINNSNLTIGINFSNIVINGWETDVLGVTVEEVGAGKKKMDYFPLVLAEAGISSISEVEEVEICFQTFDPSYNAILKYHDPVILYYDGGNWIKP